MPWSIKLFLKIIVINFAMKRDEKENNETVKKEKKIENILFNSFNRNNKQPDLKKTQNDSQFIVDWQLT
jgi:hypothetical protein